jgi:hypothetical protein
MFFQRIILSLFMLLALSVHFASAFDKGPFTFKFEDRFRYELWDTFRTAAPNFDDDYAFYGNRLRLGVGYKQAWFQVYGEYQVSHVLSLPHADDPAFGLGAAYQSFNPGSSEDLAKGTVNELYIKANAPFLQALSFKLGRFTYGSGTETVPINPMLKWMKAFRISERLIGTIDFSHTGRSFDGVVTAFDEPWYNISVAAVRPTQGTFNMDQDKPINDINVGSASVTLKNSEHLKNTEASVFYYLYDDARDADCTGNARYTSIRCFGPVRPDNTVGRAKYEANKGDVEIDSFGAHLMQIIPTGKFGAFDLLGWGAFQSGDWGKLNHNAFGATGEMGYKFTSVPWQPWLRTGYFYGSGDETPDDSEHGTFFQMLPTARLYAKNPIYNLMNNEDYFFMLLLNPHEKVKFRGDFRKIWASKSDDRWYTGAGPAHESNQFGFGAAPTYDNHDLCTLVDMNVVIDVTKYLSFETYYSRAWGDSIIERSFNKEDDLNYFYGEMIIRF